MITGSTSGVGQAAALALARMGPELVLVARNRERGEQTVAEIIEKSGNRNVELMLADLSSQQQIRKLAQDFLATRRPLHVLLNNAGVILMRHEETPDGIEKTFAVNHLGYFLLTHLLLERIRASAPARIVSVASDAYIQGGRCPDFEEMVRPQRYSSMRVYGRSKLANILFTQELARHLAGTNVTANSLHPGFVASGFARNNGMLAKMILMLLRPFARSPEKGAETAVYLCSSPEVEDVSGHYFYNCEEHRLRDFARNEEDARRLWQLSEQLIGPSTQVDPA